MEGSEIISIESIQTILCAEPHESIAILYAAKNGIVRQTILHLEVPEIIRLRRSVIDE
jgi:hypothetical protein